MRGVILAGGLGSRLLPVTRVTNKHLLPVYDRPMIYYPLQQLVHAGIQDILVVTGGNHAGDFLRLLGNGRQFGLARLHYAYQEGEGGIAEALALAEPFAEKEPLVVILGDNLFEQPIRPFVQGFGQTGSGATVLLKAVDDPERFGVAEIEEGRIARIVEKPTQPESNLAVTGCYIYDSRVFDLIRTVEPSSRGELEITDVNNQYVDDGQMHHHILSGWWTDAGTVPSLFRATNLVESARDNPLLRGPAGFGAGASPA